jgi:hypothetical protein
MFGKNGTSGRGGCAMQHKGVTLCVGSLGCIAPPAPFAILRKKMFDYGIFWRYNSVQLGNGGGQNGKG